MKNTKTLNTTTEKLMNSICKNHTGKMSGMWSVSTSALLNPECVKRSEHAGTVCHKCYAIRMLKAYKGLREKSAYNTALWAETLYSPAYMPEIKNSMFRFEAFGDLINDIQAENYMTLCEKNPGVKFALWTKKPYVLWDALKKRDFKKPRNLVVIFSSPMVNACSDNVTKLYIMPDGKPMLDKVFTVYSKEYLAKNPGVKINCGARNCKACGRCYTKRTGKIINELLK